MQPDIKVGPQATTPRGTDNQSLTKHQPPVTIPLRGMGGTSGESTADASAPWPTIFNGDRRLYDVHIAFDGRWSKEQLKPIVKRFGLPATKASYAITNLARSLVLDGKFRYSRRCEWYADRYKTNGDPFYSYRLTPKAADWLADNGYAEHILGHHVPNQPGAGRQSTLYATQKLIDTIGDLVDPLEPRAIAPRPEVIILKDDQGNPAPYIDTPETKSQCAEVWMFNDHFRMRELHRNGQLVEIPIFRRVFNLTFNRGGRLYCWGNSYQQLSGKQRREITEVIDGVTTPFAEIDFGAHHIREAYALAGKAPPDGDPYVIPGYDRDLIKGTALIPLNAKDQKSAISAVARETGCTRAQAKAAIKAFRARHPGIKGFFWSDAGARLMRMDSDISVEIMKRVLTATGRCPLPMHDSYLVPVCDIPALSAAMAEVSAEYSVKSSLKLSLPEGVRAEPGPDNHPPTPTPSTPTPSMGIHFSLNPSVLDTTTLPPYPIYGDTFSPDPSVLDRYREQRSPKNTSRGEYEQWIAANLGHDPRPPVENPEKYLAWYHRNIAFLSENGRYRPKHKRDTGGRDYACWFAADRLDAQRILEGMDPAEIHDLEAVLTHWSTLIEANNCQRQQRREAAAQKAAETRRKRKELAACIPVRRSTIEELLAEDSR